MAVPAVDVYLDAFPTYVEHAAPEIVLPRSSGGILDALHSQQVIVVGPFVCGVAKFETIEDILVIEKCQGAMVLG